MRILELLTFQALTDNPNVDRDWLLRRFMTLIAPPASEDLLGGSGAITRAFNCYGESFACKRMREINERDAYERSRIYSGRRMAFTEEYRAHQAVSGVQGVPRLYGMGMSREGPVVLMEWVEGHTLASSSSLFPVARGGRGTHGAIVAAVGASVARILLQARRSAPSFIHRDISPRNIMVRGGEQDIRRQIGSLDFRLSLIDMGSSSVPQEGSLSITMNSDIWRYGTPEYAAPEMLTKDVPGIAALRNSQSIDVYALCSVLYELYAGYTPYDMENNQRRHGVSPYVMKMSYGPISLSLHDSADRQLANMIMGGIMPKQSDRISMEDLYSGCMAYLGRRDSARRVMRDAPVRPRQTPLQISVTRPENGGGAINGPLPETLVHQMEESSRRAGRFPRFFG